MNLKSCFSPRAIAAFIILAAVILFAPWQAVAQSPAKAAATTWQDLGYNQVPEGFSTNEIPLFEGLNEARGTWTFEGEVADDEATTNVKGSLHIIGNPKTGMVAMWKMAWAWPVDDPGHLINCIVMASPNKTGFDLRLIRIGPMTPLAKKNAGIQRIMFTGAWNPKNKTVAWSESALPNRLGDQPAKHDVAKPKQSFDMVVAADGKISIRNSKHATQGQLVTSKASVRTAKAPAQVATVSGKQSFKTVAEISDPRIKPWLPPQATEISVQSDRGGHMARYKVSEADLKKFLDQLWEAKKDSSAHKRELMSGEGEPTTQRSMARFSKMAGWEPLENATTYYSPSKGSGAMTTYHYDKEAGIAYHDAGYW